MEGLPPLLRSLCATEAQDGLVSAERWLLTTLASCRWRAPR